MSTSAYLEKLKHIPLFHEIKNDADSLRLLLAVCRMKRTKAQEVVIREGELGTEMYIVFSGAVEIRKKTSSGDYYTVTRLSEDQNVFFGEMALIDDDRRSATVIALSDSEFFVIAKQDFVKFGDEHPRIGLPITRNISRILASRLRKTTQDMLTLFDALVQEVQS